jgi:hypothetical protein
MSPTSSKTHDLEAAMATMADEPFVNHVPTMTGGVGRAAVVRFHAEHFIGHWPVTPDGEDNWWRVIRGNDAGTVRDDVLADLLTYGPLWLQGRTAS